MHTISDITFSAGEEGVRLPGWQCACSCGWKSSSTIKSLLQEDASEHLRYWAVRIDPDQTAK